MGSKAHKNMQSFCFLGVVVCDIRRLGDVPHYGQDSGVFEVRTSRDACAIGRCQMSSCDAQMVLSQMQPAGRVLTALRIRIL